MSIEQDGRRAFARLRTGNIVVGIAHLIQAILMLTLSNALALPVVAGFLTTDPVLERGASPPEKLFEIPIGPAVALFLFLAAIDHLLVAGPLRSWYERKLSEGINPARWIEYSVSASIMVVLIAMFTGIRDVAALLGLFGVNTSMILFGWLMERHQTPGRADWSAFWFGCVAGAVPWIAIAWYATGGAAAPTFVYVIIVTQLLLFSVFAVNQALQYGQVGRWRSYLYGEKTYTTLSIAAKSLLAWLIFANVLRT